MHGAGLKRFRKERESSNLRPGKRAISINYLLYGINCYFAMLFCRNCTYYWVGLQGSNKDSFYEAISI